MIVLDIETSGLDAVMHGLLSIGAVNFLKPSETFYGECRIRQGEHIDTDALAVNGFSVQSARDASKQSTKELLKQFDSWLQGQTVKVVGGLHIASFDVPFLLAKAKQCRTGLQLHKRSIDLHSIAYARMLQLKKVIPLTDGWSVMDTDVIYPFCGLPKEPLPHNALTGARLEAESLARLIYGKKLLRTFAHFDIPDYLAKH